MENEMEQEYIVETCKCGAEIKAPNEYPEVDDLLKWRQFICSKCCKPHTFDYDLMIWLK